MKCCSHACAPALTALAVALLLEPWDSEGRFLCPDGLVCRRRGPRAVLLKVWGWHTGWNGTRDLCSC